MCEVGTPLSDLEESCMSSPLFSLLCPSAQEAAPETDTSGISIAQSKRPAVLADGTYATQSAAVETALVRTDGTHPPDLSRASRTCPGNPPHDSSLTAPHPRSSLSTQAPVAAAAAVPNLRALLLARDFFLASVVGTTFTKLVLRIRSVAANDPVKAREGADTLIDCDAVGVASSAPRTAPSDPRRR